MNKYMRVYAAINSEALKHNIREIKRRVGEKILIMPVIKADAYGHGALKAAEVLEEYANFYAVATVDEAVLLRQGGIRKPILIFGYTSPEEYRTAVENDISVTVFTYGAAKELNLTALKKGKTARLHIAVDTGMRRIGFECTEYGADEVKKISCLEHIFIEGMYTHFAASDEKDMSFTDFQTERFSSFNSMLQERGVKVPLLHAANSAAILDYPKAWFDMVRPGIILYGFYPSDDVKKTFTLMPVMELKSHVAYVKDIKKGDTVGYGRTFKADRDMRIATVPVGYADGYPRLLSNRGRVIINGRYASIVGRVCMDQFMVDVTEIKGVSEGDTVTLIGRDGEAEVTADEIAVQSQTISYEIVCGISKRVPRIYI